MLTQASAAAQSAQWVRLSLADGRVVEGQITGGDAVNHFVQTPHGYFSIARANVTAITLLSTPHTNPNVAPLPPPMPPPNAPVAPTYGAPPPPPPALGPTESGSSRFGAGLRVAAGMYLTTAIIAAARTEKDDDAKYGFIPLMGPIVWSTKHDSDDFLEDGYDWLALGSTIVQVGGLVGVFTGKHVTRHSLVQVTPVGRRDYGGLVVGGRW